MEDYHIEGTRKTPTISLRRDGMIRFEGRSIPEDAPIFFEKVVDWIERYVAAPNDITRVDISFEYLNSGTSKFVLQILRILKTLAVNPYSLIVNWYYEEGDDDIQERGEYYASILGLRINFIEIE